MGSNFDFTDKTQETLAAAIQLAKDYANAHGMHSRLRHGTSSWLITPLVIVVPAHIAFVLLNEGAGEQQPSEGLSQGSKNSLFTSVIQKVGGDPASLFYFICVAILRL